MRGGTDVIVGAHSIIYSKNVEADRAFLKDVLGLPHVDVGDGWLIFGLPPAEVAVHPGDQNDVHEFYLMSGDVVALSSAMVAKGFDCSPVQDYGWGLMMHLTLPGGGKLGIYQARHARPRQMAAPGGRSGGGKSGPKRPSPKRPSPKRPARQRARKPTRASARKKLARRR
jgi:hypothetical protein